MDELVRWLGEQLAEDERIAKAATPGPWWADSSIHTEAIYGSSSTAVVAGGRWGGEASVFESDNDAAHVVEWDPARVLREIDAKRRMITDVAAASASALDMEHGCCHEPSQILAGECSQFTPSDLPLLRLLALPYADRPGFREEWAP